MTRNTISRRVRVISQTRQRGISGTMTRHVRLGNQRSMSIRRTVALSLDRARRPDRRHVVAVKLTTDHLLYHAGHVDGPELGALPGGKRPGPGADRRRRAAILHQHRRSFSSPSGSASSSATRSSTEKATHSWCPTASRPRPVDLSEFSPAAAPSVKTEQADRRRQGKETPSIGRRSSPRPMCR